MSDKVVPHVAVADSPPNQCLVYPQLDHNHPKGYFILARNEFPTPFGGAPYAHDAYLSVEAAQQICRDHADLLHVVSKDDHTVALAELEALRARNRQLEEELKEADRFQESAEWTLRHFGTRVQAKPGRKPTTQKAA